jgi:hypothetical protein
MTDSLFGTQGAPYGNFKSPGTNYQGTIVRLSQVQSRKFVPEHLRKQGKQGELEFWPDMKPKMTAIVTIQTTLRDPSVQGDDGQRSVWIKGKHMTDAVKEGIRNGGAARRGLEVGGWFSMTYTHSDPEPEFEGGTPAKNYEVEYRTPENNGAEGARAASQAAQDAPLVAPGTPVAGGTYGNAQAAPDDLDARLSAAGFDVSSMTPQAKAALEAMLAAQQS